MVCLSLSAGIPGLELLETFVRGLLLLPNVQPPSWVLLYSSQITLNVQFINKLRDVGSYTSPGAPSICPCCHGFIFLRGTSLSGSGHQLHVTIVISIFFVPLQVVILLACVTMGYSNIVSHLIFCFNLCMSPLLSINIMTVIFNVFLFYCVILLIRLFCLILTHFQQFHVHSPVRVSIFWIIVCINRFSRPTIPPPPNLCFNRATHDVIANRTLLPTDKTVAGRHVLISLLA